MTAVCCSREQPPGMQPAAQHQAAAEHQRVLQPAAGDPEPSLAADPWAQDVRVPAGYNPWSIGLGGLQPQRQQQHSSSTGAPQQEPARGSVLGQAEGTAANHVVSRLNPAAGEYLGRGTVHAQQAAEQPSSSRAPAASSNIWGAQGLFGPPAASPAPQAPFWAASLGAELPSMTGRPATESAQWTPLQPPPQATSGPLDWGHGASPPFADAPLFLSSMMQQVGLSALLPSMTITSLVFDCLFVDKPMAESPSSRLGGI